MMPETLPDIAAMDAVLAVLDELAQSQLNRRTVEHPNGVVVVEEQSWRQGIWRAVYDGGQLTPLTDGTPKCGTAMCFAGWLAELDPSVRWYTTPRELYEAEQALTQTRAAVRAASLRITTASDADLQTARDMLAEARLAHERAAQHLADLQLRPDVLVVEGAGESSVGMWATGRLGLTETQADRLFSGSNDLRDLHRIVDRFRTDPEAYSAPPSPGDPEVAWDDDWDD